MVLLMLNSWSALQDTVPLHSMKDLQTPCGKVPWNAVMQSCNCSSNRQSRYLGYDGYPR